MNRLACVAGVTFALVSVSAWAVPATTPSGPGKSAPSAAAPATPNISCPGDTVVWVNPRSKAYHVEGDKFFGHTKHGKFECKKAADAEGDHPLKTGK
jgi:hypothetical protein